MDQYTLRAFRDEFEKIAAAEASEANKLFGLPLEKTPSGTRSYELGQMHEQQVQMEQEQQAAEEQAMMAQQQAAMTPPAAPKKPAGDKKKSEKKDSKGSEKVKVEVHVDGKKTDAKPKAEKKPEKPKKAE